MDNIKRVSILGCGWLGYPLALQLLNQGFKVKGSTTSQHKIDVFKEAGIIPYQFTLGNEKNRSAPADADFFQTDLLIITLPPKVRKQGPEHGIGQIESVKEATGSFDGKVIYTSSTSVYPTDGKSHNEMSLQNLPVKTSPLAHIEELLKNTFGNKLTILRLGGLFGYDRIPVKYFLDKKEIDNGHFPVNYLHRDDAVKSVMTVIDRQAWGRIYNVVAPKHPTRKQVFLRNAAILNVKAPAFSNITTGNFKIINGNKMMDELGFIYQYPDPLGFSYNHFTNPCK